MNIYEFSFGLIYGVSPHF